MELKDYLKKYFGFDSFKGNQEIIIKNILNQRDTFVLMPTGGGKSLCYQMPALIQEGTAIIISPLIALMKNQVDVMRGISDVEGVAHFLNSSLSKSEIQEVKDDILKGTTKMLYVAPESLTKEENIQFLRQTKVSFYAIDEAHCISEWGHDFRPEYRRIRDIVEEIGRAPIVALTATATPKVQSDILKSLGIPDADVFKSSFNRPNLYYEVRPKVEPNREIIKFIKNNEGKSGIIYCLSRKKVEELAEILQANGIMAAPYHAGLESSVRSENQDKFLKEEITVIVATIAFGMGIDKPDIRFVIHYDMPKSLEGYYQETGRAGRDGGEGRCIAFYSYKDIQMLEKFMQGKPQSEIEIGRLLLTETVTYAELAMCRRKHLLKYFGEDYTQDNCGCCDNCLHPREQFDGKDDVVKALKVIDVTKESYKATYIAEVICGIESAEVNSNKHFQLDEFGIGDDHDKKYWDTIIRHAYIAKLISKDIEKYGVLKITDEGRAFMKAPKPIMIVKDHDYEQEASDMEEKGSGGSAAADETLYNMLKSLCKSVAKRYNLPPFVIFQEASLQDMSIHYPITMEELQTMTGVGQGKAQKFGKEFCELIKKYVEENEIIRPMDMIVKSVPKKSEQKLKIIHSIDRRMPFETLADACGLEIDELLKEIETIVYSGTKLNIDYYINERLDQDYQDEVYEYFKEAEDDSIEKALEELGEDDYSEEDIRLMRIKFISNEGN